MKKDNSAEKREFEENNRITVGELRKYLRGYSEDTEITFGCTLEATHLIFYRVKDRGENLVQIELNEVTNDFIDN